MILVMGMLIIVWNGVDLRICLWLDVIYRWIWKD